MSTEQQLTQPLMIRGQYIRDLSFENPNPLAIFTSETEQQPNISVNVQAKAQHLGEKNFEVVLDIHIDAKRDKEQMFIVELSYAAVATVNQDVNDEKTAQMIMVDAPHLLFPFARNILADVTRDGGYPPLMLAPVDFAALYEQQKQQAAPSATIN